MNQEQIKISLLSKLINDNFPGLRFYTNHLKQAGKILKRQGEEATIVFLTDKGKEKLFDFQPPAKVLIVAKSRDFAEWPIVKASVAIQTHTYGLPHQELKELSDLKLIKNGRNNWIEKSGVNVYDYTSAQGLNLIFNHAKSIYEGVLVKVKNRNEKKKSKIERINKSKSDLGLDLLSFEEEKALDENGKLLQPPGINKAIYCYQQISPKPCKNLRDLENVPPEFLGYYKNPDEPIKQSYVDRLSIPKGEPGHVPDWQHPMLNNKKSFRRRKWYAAQNLKPKTKRKPTQYSSKLLSQHKSNDMLLCQISIGDDWVLFDARGLLRNLHWRGLVPSEGLSLNQILDQFTGDPVIDPDRNVITFIYKQNVLDVHSEKVISYKKSPELIKKLTETNPVCLVSIDLGQNNPISAQFSHIDQKDSELIPSLKGRQFLPEFLLKEISAFRTKSDQVSDEIRVNALQELSPEFQEEFNRVDNDTPENVIGRIIAKLNIDLSVLPLSDMSAHTTYISDAYLATERDPSLVMFKPFSKKGSLIEPALQKKKDYTFAKEEKLSVSKEAREAMSEMSWKLQRESLEYKKLSRRKVEWARRCVNYLLREGKKLTGCSQVIFNIENLNIDNRMFSGSGKRENGWTNFFKHKKENRWFIQVLHRAFSDLAPHKGMYVIESSPAYTSTTCTKCGHCDKNNRNGITFICLNCGFEANTDLEIATDNIEKVALSGKGMPKPKNDCERWGDVKKPGRDRKAKKSSVSADIDERKEVEAVDGTVEEAILKDTARKQGANAA